MVHDQGMSSALVGSDIWYAKYCPDRQDMGLHTPSADACLFIHRGLPIHSVMSVNAEWKTSAYPMKLVK